MIKDVKIIPLKRIVDERGKIMHMMRCDSEYFTQFGEIYFSTINPGAIKGWHLHKFMTLNYTVVKGNIKLVLYDARPESETYKELQEIFIGQDNYCLVSIPPRIVNGFKTIGNREAIVANCSDIPHDSQEIERINPFDKEIGYNWDIKQG